MRISDWSSDVCSSDLGNQEYMPPREGFYMTDVITRHAVETLEGRAGKKEPFFMYVAYTAPHYPLHALPEDIARYKGMYTEGWDKLREKRYNKQKELGIADASMQISPRDPQVPDRKRTRQNSRH